MKRFDRFAWKPTLYRSAAELDAALKEFGVCEKKIRKVNTIGFAENLSEWTRRKKICCILNSAGVPCNKTDSYEYLDRILLPCEAVLCEPTVLVFDDNSTLEMMPLHGQGLLVSVNQISADIVNGINDSNVNSTRLFRGIVGCSIGDAEYQKLEKTGTSGASSYQEKRTTNTYQFRLNGDFGFFFRTTWVGSYTFGLTDQKCFGDIGNPTATAANAKLSRAVKRTNQVVIKEGSGSGGSFWIAAFDPANESNIGCRWQDEYRRGGISIDESDVDAYLYCFLAKYFDPDYPYEDDRGNYGDKHFEWYCEPNVYTYETVRKMLEDIERCCRLLKRDYDSAELDGMKQHLSCCPFASEEELRRKHISPEDKNRIIRENIGVVIDFYRRFVRRMRAMMENAPEYGHICFTGP